jgi:hypothetical protein
MRKAPVRRLKTTEEPKKCILLTTGMRHAGPSGRHMT